MIISILTATYNRKDVLQSLCLSLSSQTNKQFEWVIIDDGSTDGTEKKVLDWDYDVLGFNVRYYKKENGGKSRAINYGLAKCDNAEFALIIDDDEQLYSNAVDIVYSYIDKYRNTSCVGMEFLRNDKSHKPIANYAPTKDLIMSVQERKRRRLEIDGYTGYFIAKLGDQRFPEFDGEKYVGPGVLQMIVSKTNDLVWPCVALGETEYLEGGITSEGRKLRLKNPKGMITYCNLLQDNKSGFLIRTKYSIMGYAYSSFIIDANERDHFLSTCHFYKFCYIPGLVLGKIWKNKFDN